MKTHNGLEKMTKRRPKKKDKMIVKMKKKEKEQTARPVL